MLQQPSPAKGNKSTRPFLSFLKPVKRMEGPLPLAPPPLEPLPPRPDRPDTAASILAPNGRDTPSRHYPTVTFASPIRRSHSRNASNPIPHRTPPTTRARSGTVQSSTNTFGVPSPPRLADRPMREHRSGSPDVSLADFSPSRPPPKHRKRPSALHLTTSNLGPPLPLVSPGTPTPQPPRMTPPALTQAQLGHSSSASVIKTGYRRERRRSRSTGDLTTDAVPVTSSTPPHHRASRSESAMQLDILAPPLPIGAMAGRSEVYTPASTLSTLSIQTPRSDNTEKTTSGGRFENVPLPWSTHPLLTLESSLPPDYLSRAAEQLFGSTPVILTPDTFASLSSEESRLQLELDRLKVKHTRLGQHRDKLLIRSFARLQTTEARDGGASMLRSVQDAVGRVDRVARQIYICNDQIRQMEVMKRDHEVGVLLWALQGRNSRHVVEQGSDNPSLRSHPVQQLEAQEPMYTPATVPDIQLTRATIFDSSSSDDPVVSEEGGLEYLKTPDADPSTSTSPPSPTTDRPLSTVSNMSLSLSPINLGFPLPPSRPSLHSNDESSLQLSLEPGSDPLLTPTSGHQIVIYPPAEHVDSSLPDLPHTPLRSEDHSHEQVGERPLPPLPPLRTRRSKPDLSVYIPDTTTSVRQIRIAQPPAPAPGAAAVGTSPLKLNVKARYQSLDVLKLDGQKRFKRGRESTLENPESILLSLATAELWTKEAFADWAE